MSTYVSKDSYDPKRISLGTTGKALPGSNPFETLSNLYRELDPALKPTLEYRIVWTQS
jgi:hypothetical protein